MAILDFLFGGKQISDCITVLDKHDYKQALTTDNIRPVDVRTAREFGSGHIQKAINIDFFKPSGFRDAFSKMDKNQPVYLYCQSGNRSQKAARRLVDMGFTMIYDLKGGFNNWN